MKLWKKIILGLWLTLGLLASISNSSVSNDLFGSVYKLNPFTKKMDLIATSTSYIAEIDPIWTMAEPDYLKLSGRATGQSVYGGSAPYTGLNIQDNPYGGGLISITSTYLNSTYDSMNWYADRSGTVGGPYQTMTSNYGYTQFGMNHSPVIIGDLPLVSDPLNRIQFGIFSSTSIGAGSLIINSGMATPTTGNLVIGNDLTQVGTEDIPTHITLLGRTSSKYNQSSTLPLKSADSSYLYSSDGNLLLGSAGTSTDRNRVDIFSGSRTTRNSIHITMTPTGVGVNLAGVAPRFPLEVGGMASFLDGIGIGTTPDINFNLKVKDDHTVGIDLQAGDGYNLLYFERLLGFATTTPLGYLGLGSLFDNSLQVATYAGVHAPIQFGAGSKLQLYMSAEQPVDGSSAIYSQFQASTDLFSIGYVPTSTLTAKLDIKDARDASTDRTGIKFDTSAAAWTANSRLMSLNTGGTERFLVDGNGISSQGVTTTPSSVNNAPVLLFSKPLANFRIYNVKVRMEGLAGSMSDSSNFTMQGFFKKVSGTPTQTGDTQYTCTTEVNCTTLSFPYFVINGNNVEVWARGRAGQTWTYTAWLNFEVQA